jgi:D-3-phosphoglycerate dehydrogenase
MSVNTKPVFCAKYLSHSMFSDLPDARPEARLDRLENDSDEKMVASKPSAAQAYRVGMTPGRTERRLAGE